MAIFFYRLHCRRCDFHEVLSRHEAQRRLQAHKKLRAGVEPDEALLDELVPTLLRQLPCHQCGATGLEVGIQADVGDWSDQRQCIACGHRIPAARLAVVPDAELCTACQAAVERGHTPGPPAYCKRCGNLMKLSSRQVGGRTKYVWQCTNQNTCGYWTERAL